MILATHPQISLGSCSNRRSPNQVAALLRRWAFPELVDNSSHKPNSRLAAGNRNSLGSADATQGAHAAQCNSKRQAAA